MDDFTLRVFYKLAQLKNFSKVADELYISQPAVSRQIKNLEDSLAVKLCMRKKEGVSLTEEGKILFKYAEKILALYEKGIQEIDKFRHSKLNKITIGASTTLGEYVLPRIISGFRKRYCDADIYLKVANMQQILNQLATNAFDLTLVEGEFDNPSFMSEKVFEDELVLIVSTQHLWANILRKINLNELKSQPIIIREEGSGTRKILEKSLAKSGVALSDLNIKMELDSTEAVKNAVRENLGISFVSKSTLVENPQLKVVFIENMDFRFDFNLIYPRENSFNSLTIEFMECLKTRLFNQFDENLCL